MHNKFLHTITVEPPVRKGCLQAILMIIVVIKAQIGMLPAAWSVWQQDRIGSQQPHVHYMSPTIVSQVI